jgi:predicted permease
MDTLLHDIRYALRSLARTPGFTAVAVLTLTLGIGAATAGFSLFNWVLLRPVPGVQDGARLADVWFGQHRKDGSVGVSGISYEQQNAMLTGVPALAGMVGRQGYTMSFLVGDAVPSRLSGEFVSASYFDLLGVRPFLGRGFSAEDDLFPNGARAVVISHRVWREWFGSRADVLGQTVRINAIPFSVIGVAPRGFQGPERLGDVDLWLPGRNYADVARLPAAARERWSGSGSGGYYQFVIRLAPGATFAQAEQQLQVALQQIAPADSQAREDFSKVSAKVYPGIGLFALGRDLVVRPLRLVMGIVALVLIIACANVANLLLLRGAGRRGETAVRIALGASRRRIIQQHTAEAVVLATSGAGAGVLLAVWLTALFRGTQLARLEVRDVGVDWRVAAFAVAVALVTALLVAVAPALAAQRTDVSAGLKNSATQATRAPLRGGLVVLQVAVSLTLVVGALLLARTFEQLARVPLGMDPAGVLAFAVQPRDVGYDGARTRTYYREVVSSIDALPGVDRATIAQNVPFVCCTHSLRVGLPGGEPNARVGANANTIGAGYFETLGIPILVGRDFTRAEVLTDSAIASPPALLSEGLARRLFDTENPVGKILELPRYQGPSMRLQVVGVAGDSRWNSLEREVPLMLYLPLGYDGIVDRAQLLVRTTGSTDVGATVARAARALDANLPLGDPKSVPTAISRNQSPRRLLLRLLGVLSIVTVVLAAVGLYGLVSHGVALRTREFGIRMALGAAEHRILMTVVRGGLRLAVVGIVLGGFGAVALTRLLRAYLFGVSPFDPVSLIVAAVALAMAALLACWIPARRASRVDPMVALRSE